MRVFIFGMIGPPHGLRTFMFMCVCVYVKERKICREEVYLWPLFRCIKISLF